MDPGRTIGQLARDAGVNVETVRYYERRGLLCRPRRASGWRRYDDDHLRTLRFIRRAQGLGFSLAEVEGLLALRSSSSPRVCARVRAAAEARVADVEARLRDLEALRRALLEVVQRCPADGPGEACPILKALAAPEGGCCQ
ncbi:MAG: MerR family transcriptional regulator [Deltaproteobacteria bacterium]|nr:MerR family transcriptional regulator [Deltaproteobacteria bacterium]